MSEHSANSGARYPFRRYEKCSTEGCKYKIYPDDTHTLCLQCLGGQHDTKSCDSCKRFAKQNLQTRAQVMQK